MQRLHVGPPGADHYMLVTSLGSGLGETRARRRSDTPRINQSPHDGAKALTRRVVLNPCDCVNWRVTLELLHEPNASQDTIVQTVQSSRS